MNIDQIAAAASQVATEYDASQGAREERVAAEAALFAKLVENVRPALRALSSRIQSGSRTWWPTNVGTDTKNTFHDARGVRVAGDGPNRDYPHANAGEYEGAELYLLDDGTFAVVEYSGRWSRWQGATSEWEGRLVRLTDCDAVVRCWGLDEIVESISTALTKAIGTRENPTKAQLARAERARAIATLIGGGK